MLEVNMEAVVSRAGTEMGEEGGTRSGLQLEAWSRELCRLFWGGGHA